MNQNLSHQIIKRLRRNYWCNLWWLKILVYFKVPKLLIKQGLTTQAVGVIFNPLTSNRERIQILKRNLNIFK